MDLASYNAVRRTKVCIYGPPKSGKTAMVGKLAEAGFTLWWCDLESGVKTLMNPAMLKPEARKNVKLFNFPDRRDFPIAIDAVRLVLKPGTKRKFCFAHGVMSCPNCVKTPNAVFSEEIDIGQFTDKDVLVIDSASQLTSSALNKVTLKPWQKDDEYKPTFDDWRVQGMYLDQVFSAIQAFNINAAIISHEVDVEKDEKKEKIVPLGGTRNFSNTFAKYFDEVVYCHIFNKSHRAQNSTTWSPNHLTGGRTGVTLTAPTQGSESSDNPLAKIFTGE
jgi:hypothetical protein